MSKLILLLALIGGLVLVSRGAAEEPSEAFLDALRENGYYEIALSYLDSMEKSALASEEFKQQIPFEKAETLISSTSTLRDLNVFEDRLNQAQKLLSDFSKDDVSLQVRAKTFLSQGNLFYGRSKIAKIRSDNERLTADEKKPFIVQSRDMLTKALVSYQNARETIRKLIDPKSADGLPIDPEDPSTTARLKYFQTLYTRVRIRTPMVVEQLADTYPNNDPERKKKLAEAVKGYNEVSEDYFRFAAGLEAVLYSSRCSQKLGRHTQAVSTLEDLFSLSDRTEFKPFKRRAFLQATESWEKMKPYPADQVIAYLQPTVELLNRIEVRQPDWQRIMLELSVAQHKKAAEIQSKDPNPQQKRVARELEQDAAKRLKDIARKSPEHRDKANQLLSDWDIKIEDISDDATLEPPTDFVDARDRAKDNISEIESLIAEANDLRRELATASGAQKAAKQAELDTLNEDISELANKSLDLLDAALRLKTDTTIRADVNGVRYLQSFCYFAMNRFMESALIAEFLLDKYPSVDGTRPAMVLLVQSYTQMLDRADDTKKEFELKKLTTACQRIVETWPGTSESGLAASTMVRLGILNKDYDMAQTYIAEVPSDAEYLPALASRFGQRLWFDYKSKLPITPVNKEAITAQRDQAKIHLITGAQEARLKDLTPETALGCLLLVDAYLETDEVDKAVNQLENADIAPLDLVKQKHPAIFESNLAPFYPHETYKIAIKTYLAALKNDKANQKWVDKARGVISAMQSAADASQDPQDQQRLTLVYRLIAKELKDQFEQLQSADEKKNFSKTLATFLGSIEKQSKDSRTILWAGSALMSTAQSLNDLGLDEASKPLFSQAVSALSRAEEIGFGGDPKEAALLDELKRQRALAQRGSGQYEKAVEQLVELLKANPKSLRVQIDAAETLQAWAKATKRSKLYAEAMMGGHKATDPNTKRPTNLIWGWRKMVQATRGNEKFVDTFYNALYHLAECRFQYGVLEKSKKAMKSSLTEINNAEKRDPTLGGPTWKAKFEDLKKQIQAKL